jgi:tetratricopeptide (TPR) repeat protein
MVRWYSNEKDEPQWKGLLRLAQAADPDPWRTQVREALINNDQVALAKLASSDQALQLRPWTLSAVGRQLSKQRAWRLAEALLRKAQQRYPDDFWLNHALAYAIWEQKDPSRKVSREAEALPFWRVCVALRPQSPGARVNLSTGLNAAGDLDGAIAEAREAIRLKGDYAAPHYNLARRFRDKKDLDGAIAEFRATIGLDAKYKDAHTGLAIALRAKKELDEAIVEYRKVIDLDPNDPGPHNGLGNVLRDKKDLVGAIAEYHKAIDLDPKHANAYNGLGIALRGRGQLDDGIAAHRKAIDLDPKDFRPHNNLGNALYDKQDLDGAMAEYRKAVELDPKSSDPHNGLGNALRAKKEPDRAIVEYRKAIALDPKFAEPHNGLGNALRDKKQLDEYIAEYNKALDLDPKDARPRFNLADALYDNGRLEEAIVQYRKALDLDPQKAVGHVKLGNALFDTGQREGAVTEYRKALDLDPDFASAHYELGQTLLRQGRFAEARTATRRCLELLPDDAPLRPKASRQLKQCERLVELEPKLPDILSGKEQPANDRERADYADLCQKKRLYAAAARLYGKAIRDNPELVASPDDGLRYDAACAAALAGCGKREDAAQVDEAERGRWRQQALDWLRADLALWAKQLEGEKAAEARATVQKKLRRWQQDPDLAGVRDDTALAKLPDAVRQAWRQFWSDVQQLLDRATMWVRAPGGPRPPAPPTVRSKGRPARSTGRYNNATHALFATW